MWVTLDWDTPTDLKMNFRDSVLNWNNQMKKLWWYTFPMSVAQILETPRWPTSYQDSLKGIIVPNFWHSDENRRINVWYWIWYLNAVILYIYELFRKWEYEQAYWLVCYMKDFETGFRWLNPGASDWILTSSTKNGQYLRHWSVTEELSRNPYEKIDIIFAQ